LKEPAKAFILKASRGKKADGHDGSSGSSDLEGRSTHDLPAPAHKARRLLWKFASSKVEPGETKEQALIRECREELGVQVAVDEEFTQVTHVYPDLAVHLTVFHARITRGTVQKLEHHDICYMTPGEISNYNFCPADQAILQKLIQEETPSGEPVHCL